MPLCRPSVRARLRESLAPAGGGGDRGGSPAAAADGARDAAAGARAAGGFRRTRDAHTLAQPGPEGGGEPSPPAGDPPAAGAALIRELDAGSDSDDDEVPPLMT